MIQLERCFERCDGGPLISMIAHTGDSSHPTVVWENPLRGGQWHDDEIGVAGCLLSLVNAVRNGTEPSYGAQQGKLDQEIILALRQSAAQGGNPVNFPLISK
jgi:predicted dehydrogenase